MTTRRQSPRELHRPMRLTLDPAAERPAAPFDVATEIFDGAVDDDYRELAKLGDALRAVRLQLGRASLVRDGHLPSIDNTDQRERRGAEVLSAMTGGTCSVEGIKTLLTLCDYHGLRARQLAPRSRRAA